MFICTLGVMGWVGSGPSNSIVNQSPNPWNLKFEILDLDFRLDNVCQSAYDPSPKAPSLTICKIPIVKLSKEGNRSRKLIY